MNLIFCISFSYFLPILKRLNLNSLDQLSLYELKKLQATMARQQKPKGETRTPTASWAGWGFSQSLSDSMLRDEEDLPRGSEQAWGIPTDSIAEEEGGSLDLSVDDDQGPQVLFAHSLNRMQN